jgi:hypothetical protein
MRKTVVCEASPSGINGAPQASIYAGCCGLFSGRQVDVHWKREFRVKKQSIDLRLEF